MALQYGLGQFSGPQFRRILAQLRHRLLLTRQVAQLSQRNRAAGWVSFGWVVGDGVGQTILCTERCRCQKTKSINLLHDKTTFIRKTVTLDFEPLFGGLGTTSVAHLRLIG